MKDIRIRLNLDTGGFSGSIRKAGGDLSKFRGSLGQTDKALDRSRKQTRKWGKSLRDVVVTVGQARYALLNLNTVILGLPRSIIKANAELERMKLLMVGLGGGAGTFSESNVKAKESVEGIYAMARRAPFEVGALTDAFVKLKAAGIDPTDGSLQSLVDSVAKFGGTSEQLKRASIAIQQMSGKGVISMEELRQQLGEAVPNAVLLMARALDVSMGELVDKISQGTVEAKSALQAMFSQMAIENSGAALIMTTTWDGTINRLKTRWIGLQKVIGEAGFYDAAKAQLKEFTDEFMTSRDVKALAHKFGLALKEIVLALRGSIDTFKEWKGLILLAAKAFVVFKLASAAAKIKITLFTAAVGASSVTLKTAFLQSLFATSGAMTTLSLRSTIAATVMATLKLATKGLIVAVRGLSAAMRANPIGLAITAAWLLYEAYQALKGETKDLSIEWDKMNPEFISTAELQSAKDRLKAIKDAQIEASKDMLMHHRLMLAGKDKGGKYNEALERSQVGLEESKTLEKLIARAREIDALTIARAKARDIAQLAAQDMTSIRVAYVTGLEAFRTEVDARNIDPEEKRKIKGEENQKRKNAVIDQWVTLLKKSRSAEVEALNVLQKDTVITEANMLAKQAQLAVVEDLNKEIESIESQRGKKGDLVIVDSDKKTLSAIERFMSSTDIATAKLGARMKDTGVKVAEFWEKWEQGLFLDKELKEAALASAVAYDKKAAALKKTKEITTEYERNIKRVNKLEGIAAKLTDKAATTNPWIKKQAEVKQYIVELEKMSVAMKAGIADLASLDPDGEDDAIQKKIAKMKADWAGLTTLMKSFEGAGQGTVLAAMEKKAIGNMESLLTNQERVTAKYQRLKEEAVKWLESQDSISVQGKRQWLEYFNSIDLVQRRLEETPMSKLFRSWEDSSVRFQETFATAMDGASKVLTDFLVDGEADFASFAKSILKMIVEIAIQKQIAGLVGNMFPTLGGGGTGGYTAPGGTAGGAPVGSLYDGSFAMGGIMSAAGVAPLRKYAKGGIANRPQVALFGEGDTPEAFVPLPDGRRIPVKMDVSGQGKGGAAPVVNVINKGQPAQVENSNQSFDGKKWVLDIIMTEASKPGPFRDTMKGGR